MQQGSWLQIEEDNLTTSLRILSSQTTSYKLCKGQQLWLAFHSMDYDAELLLDA